MYDVYAFPTPNSVKAVIMLEELSQEYRLHRIDVKQGEQKQADFLALNPNGKVPVLVDNSADSIGKPGLSESAAILVYLAEKHKQLLPLENESRARVFEQLFFHASAVSPSFGQAGFFQRLASETQPLAIQRFSAEARRVTALLDSRLAGKPFMAGDDYSIADIAHFGWFWRREFAGINLESFRHVSRWYAAINERPAVQQAISRLNALVS